MMNRARKENPSSPKAGAPTRARRPLPKAAAGYDQWVASRMDNRCRCAVEPAIACIPLRGDSICMSCFEADVIESLGGGEGQ